MSAALTPDHLALLAAMGRPRAATGLRFLLAQGRLFAALPELASLRDCSQPPAHHAFDVLEHTLQVVRFTEEAATVQTLVDWFPGLDGPAVFLLQPVAARSRLELLRWAALLHDVGKPVRRQETAGRISFHGHETAGERLARDILTRLDFAGGDITHVTRLVALHLRPGFLVNGVTPPAAHAIRRLQRAAGAALPDLLILSLADYWGKRGPATDPAALAGRRERLGRLAISAP